MLPVSVQGHSPVGVRRVTSQNRKHSPGELVPGEVGRGQGLKRGGAGNVMGEVTTGHSTPVWVRRQVMENQEGFLEEAASHKLGL